MGMLRCNLVEDEEPAMSRFLVGLNREIQDILAYKEYTNITRLFILLVKLKGKCRDDVLVASLMFLHLNPYHGSNAALLL